MRHVMNPDVRYNVACWRDILYLRRLIVSLKNKPKEHAMRNLIIIFISVLFTGCGTPRHTVQFNNTSDITIDKKYIAYFEEKISAKTSAKFITYKITTFTEGSRAQRALFWFKGGEARVSVSLSGMDAQGTQLFAKNDFAECAWGFTGGSVYSCLADIATRLP